MPEPIRQGIPLPAVKPKEEGEDHATSAPASLLPSALPGVSIAVGLHYCNDREAFYLRMLKEFLLHKSREGAHLCAAFDQENLAAARRITHSMKSVAGSIGATELAGVSAQLEQALRDFEAGACRPLVERFHAELAVVVDGLEVFLASQGLLK